MLFPLEFLLSPPRPQGCCSIAAKGKYIMVRVHLVRIVGRGLMSFVATNVKGALLMVH